MNLKPDDEPVTKLLQNDKQIIAEVSIVVEKIVRRWNWPGNLDYQDVAQEIFCELISNLRAGKFRRGSKLTTYTYSIARNICIDKYRQAKAVDLADIDQMSIKDDAPSAEDRLISKEERKTACRVLLSLPEECRKLWRAIFWGKRTYAQAGELLGLSEGTIKRKMWECRKTAREMVGRFE